MIPRHLRVVKINLDAFITTLGYAAWPIFLGGFLMDSSGAHRSSEVQAPDVVDGRETSSQVEMLRTRTRRKAWQNCERFAGASEG